MFQGIVGHKEVCQFLARSIEAGRVAHAYLFVGPEGVGKMTMARAFALGLLRGDGGKVLSVDVHPDVVFMGRDVDEKTGVLKGEITVEQIRDLRTRLAHSSLLPSWKIAVIDEADMMNLSAANAFLKNLEEPTPKTVIILLARDMRSLPETVKSRVQMIRFGTVREEEIRAALVLDGLAARDVSLLVRAAGGRPGYAMTFARDRKAFKDFTKEIAVRAAVLDAPVHERVRFIDKTVKGAKSAALEEEFRLWRIVLRDRFLGSLGLFDLQSDSDEKTKAGDINHATKTLKRMAEAELASKSHVDPRLVFAHFLLS